MARRLDSKRWAEKNVESQFFETSSFPTNQWPCSTLIDICSLFALKFEMAQPEKLAETNVETSKTSDA